MSQQSQIARLLDRERELRELGDALSDARRERGRIVVIEGPAGIGKTTLLAALLDDAAEQRVRGVPGTSE